MILTVAILAVYPVAAFPPQSVGGELVRLASFRAPTSIVDEDWGCAVDFAGDLDSDGVPDYLIGAERSRRGGYIRGALHVISGATGTEIRRHDGVADGDRLGSSVARVGDLDGDGILDYVVGAPDHSHAGVNGGGAWYAYSGQSGALLGRGYGSIDGGSLGEVVARSGDVNDDGVPDFLVAEPGVGYTPIGTVYVISGRDGQIIHALSGAPAGSGFAKNVAAVGDLDSDGASEILVGAFQFKVGSDTLGCIYLYSGRTGALLSSQIGSSPYSAFGYAVSGFRDYDEDGTLDFLVGAHWTYYGPYGAVFIVSGATMQELHVLTGDYLAGGYGDPICSTGDMDGDDVTDFVVGAPGHSVHSYGGSFYLYSGADASLIRRVDGIYPSGRLGSSVASASDFDQDGNHDLIVGEAHFNSYGDAYVYGFHSFLRTSKSALSASRDEALHFDLAFPSDSGNGHYRILASAHGTGPMVQGGILVPLTRDDLVRRTGSGDYRMFPRSFGMTGVLDAQGRGAAAIAFPAGFLSSMTGRSFYCAAVAETLGGAVRRSSVARVVAIEP